MRIIHCFIFCGLVSGVRSLVNITVAAKLNGHVTLPCRLPMPLETGVIVRWYSGKDSWLTSGSRVYKHKDHLTVEKPAPNEWNLRIDKLDLSFADVYTCHTDSNQTISIITLVIESAPKVDESLSTENQYHVKENELAIMRCKVSGTPTPTIEWFRGLTEMKPIGILGSKLKIRNVRRYASDAYICRATNKIGVADKMINLTVDFEPEVDVLSPEVFASQGEAAVLTCVVQSSPPAEAYWTDRNGKRIATSWKHLIKEERIADGVPVKFIVLIIRPAIITIHEYGNYTCHAKSETKAVSRVVTLKERVLTKLDGEKVIHYN